MSTSPTRLIRGCSAAVTVIAMATVAGCASNAQSPTPSLVTDTDRYGSDESPITLTMWSWGGGDTDAIEAAYHELHPNVTVDITQFGGSGDVYTKLGVALKAGQGAPDLTGMELMNLPSFVAQGGLADLSAYGGEATDFDPAAAAAATVDDALYAIPTDTGPLVMYYNAALFESLGIATPTTWDEYRQAAERLKESGHFIAHMDPGDPSLPLGLLQQARSEPFTLEGTTDLTVEFDDEGAQMFTDYWTAMLDDGLVQPEPAWSQEWFNHLADGTYATWLTGAWGGSVLSSSISQVAGDWRVAALPNWDADAPSNGVWGGSGTAVTVQSKHPAAATAFAQWYSEDQYLDQLDNAANMPFPANQKVLDDPRYVEAESDFLGGQKPGELYIAASTAVNPDWQFLPYQLYANTIFKDTVGQSIAGDHDLASGLEKWKEKIVEYGEDQGFTVTSD